MSPTTFIGSYYCDTVNSPTCDMQGGSTTAENMSGKASRGSYIPAREGIFAVNFALD